MNEAEAKEKFWIPLKILTVKKGKVHVVQIHKVGRLVKGGQIPIVRLLGKLTTA
jgi:hypothetical protein